MSHYAVHCQSLASIPVAVIYEHWQRDRDADPSLIRTDVFYLLRSS